MKRIKSNSVLEDIVANKLKEVATRKTNHPLAEWLPTVTPAHPKNRFESCFRHATSTPKLILELKPKSPSAGPLTKQLELDGRIDIYNRFGVAISVLTDTKYFGGSFDLLNQVIKQSPHPVLCKDFILNPYQIYEARRHGASAVLLIAKILTNTQLIELTALSRELGMTPLIEIQNECELERALVVYPTVLLINNRNLETLEVDLNTTVRLSTKIPENILRITASGIQSKEDIQQLSSYCGGFLIGSALMQASPMELTELLESMVGE